MSAAVPAKKAAALVPGDVFVFGAYTVRVTEAPRRRCGMWVVAGEYANLIDPPRPVRVVRRFFAREAVQLAVAS